MSVIARQRYMGLFPIGVSVTATSATGELLETYPTWIRTFSVEATLACILRTWRHEHYVNESIKDMNPICRGSERQLEFTMKASELFCLCLARDGAVLVNVVFQLPCSRGLGAQKRMDDVVRLLAKLRQSSRYAKINAKAHGHHRSTVGRTICKPFFVNLDIYLCTLFHFYMVHEIPDCQLVSS